jgi:pimeloyl-ACP methyl ester carboxylesterase
VKLGLLSSLRARRFLGRVTVGAALLATAAAGTEHLLERRDEAVVEGHSFADVDGRKVRYKLVKGPARSPTVVLLSGMDATLEQWAPLQRALANDASSLTYDRSGMGFSDGADGPDAASTQAQELLALLESLKVPRPIVLVSYSSASLVARELTDLHRKHFDATLFVDPYMPEVLLKEPRWRVVKLVSQSKWASFKQLGKTMLGLNRAKHWLRGDEESWPGWRDAEIAVMRAAPLRTAHRKACFDALFEWSDTLGPPLTAGRWGDFPITVMSTAPDGPDRRLHEELAKESRDGRIVQLAEGVSHVSLSRENSGLVLSNLRELLSRPSFTSPRR